MATREGRHHSRAAADVAVDVMDLRTASLKRVAEACVRTQILRPLVRLNFGDEAAAIHTPRFSWGDVERRVSAEEAGALAKLMKFADQTQRDAMFTALGYPPGKRETAPVPTPDDGGEVPVSA
jgi:phage gp29-like protein